MRNDKDLKLTHYSNTVMHVPKDKRVRKIHDVNGTKVVTIHPDIIRELQLDTLTFLEQEVKNGTIIMKPWRLSA
jgi:hypothetical protein